MATYIGDDGVVKVGANVMANVLGFEVSETAGTIETTAKGDAAVTRKVGRKDWSGSVDVIYDDADTAQQALSVGAEVALDLYPGGNASGKSYKQGTALVTSFQITSAEGEGNVTAKMDVVGNGALTDQTVA